MLDSSGSQAAQTVYTYTTSATSTGSIVGHGTANAGGPHLQSVQQWLNTTGGYLTTTFSSDDTDEVISVQDPLGNTTTYGHDATDTFVTNVTRPTTGNGVSHVSKTQYDYSSGSVTQTDNENSVANSQAYSKSYMYYQNGANVGRLESIQAYDGWTTTFAYPSTREIDTSVLQTSGVPMTTSAYTDMFARSSPQVTGGISTETTYDYDGRVYCVTNPHLVSGSSSTDGSTCTTYDGMDRPILRTMPDLSTILIQYYGNITTVTDEAGHQKKFTYDAFKRLTDVWEQDDLAPAKRIP